MDFEEILYLSARFRCGTGANEVRLKQLVPGKFPTEVTDYNLRAFQADDLVLLKMDAVLHLQFLSFHKKQTDFRRSTLVFPKRAIVYLKWHVTIVACDYMLAVVFYTLGDHLTAH